MVQPKGLGVQCTLYMCVLALVYIMSVDAWFQAHTSLRRSLWDMPGNATLPLGLSDDGHYMSLNLAFNTILCS